MFIFEWFQNMETFKGEKYQSEGEKETWFILSRRLFKMHCEFKRWILWLLKEFGDPNRKQELRNTLTYKVVYIMYMIYNSNCMLSSSFIPFFLPSLCSARKASQGIAHDRQELYHWTTFAASHLSIWDRVLVYGQVFWACNISTSLTGVLHDPQVQSSHFIYFIKCTWTLLLHFWFKW